MKKYFNSAAFSIIALVIITSCNKPSGGLQNQSTAADKEQIAATLDQFNEAAARADFNRYFDFFTEDAVFIGTDATEHWDKRNFMAWAKPHFDKKKTWSFNSIGRHIYFDKNGELAWFDELLNTQMKICRGSGILIKKGGEWKIQQYVLSMTIPNSLSDSVVKLKAPLDDQLIQKLSQQ